MRPPKGADRVARWPTCSRTGLGHRPSRNCDTVPSGTPLPGARRVPPRAMHPRAPPQDADREAPPFAEVPRGALASGTSPEGPPHGVRPGGASRHRPALIQVQEGSRFVWSPFGDRGDMETWDAIRSRRNVRIFADRPVGAADLERILEAARRTPSSSNRQRWDFVVVTDRETLATSRRGLAGSRACGPLGGHHRADRSAGRRPPHPGVDPLRPGPGHHVDHAGRRRCRHRQRPCRVENQPLARRSWGSPRIASVRGSSPSATRTTGRYARCAPPIGGPGMR